jgi:hypothetical protein
LRAVLALGQHLFSRINAIRDRYPSFRADSSLGAAALVVDQAVHVVGEIGERQFGLGPCDADGADEQPEAVLVLKNPGSRAIREPLTGTSYLPVSGGGRVEAVRVFSNRSEVGSPPPFRMS